MIETFELITNIGEATVIVILCNMLISQFKKTPLNNRYLPVLSMILGLIIGIIIGAVYHDTAIANTAVFGLMAGGFASGSYDVLAGTFFHKHNQIDTSKNNTVNTTTESVNEVMNINTPDNVETPVENKTDGNKAVFKDKPQQIK